MEKKSALENLQIKVEKLIITFTRTSDVQGLYTLLKECHITLDESLSIGKMPPDDIDIQETVWKTRDKITKLGNDIGQKLSSIKY